MTDVYMADISEFQSNINAPAYLNYHKNIICRVHNGWRADDMMPGRLNYLRKQPFVGVGLYQYLVASRSPIDQAVEFMQLVGSLRSNEYPILDIEEGAGDQTERAQEWFATVDAWANLASTLYSDLAFIMDQLGGPAPWVGRPTWVAAYGPDEPTIPHELWQCRDNATFTAITPSSPVDMSVHHGTDEDFIFQMRHARSEVGS